MLLETVLLAVVVVAVVQFLRLLTTDCDLTLQWAEMFGKVPDTLKGKVVWITGASGVLGEALVYRLASIGCRLVLSARSREVLERVKDECLVRCRNVTEEDLLVLPLDLLQHDAHQRALDSILEHFKQVDILVNSAGQFQRALCSETSNADVQKVLDINTLAPIALAKTVLPHMAARKQGTIVVVSSLVGMFGNAGIASYSSSKHALHGWFESMRLESQEYNVKVTVVCPGAIISNAVGTETRGQTLKAGPNQTVGQMDTSRYAQLVAVAMANDVEEAWITREPSLFCLYLNQYVPSLGRKFGVVNNRKLRRH